MKSTDGNGFVYIAKFESKGRTDVVKVGRTSDLKKRSYGLLSEYRMRYLEDAVISHLFMKPTNNWQVDEKNLITEASAVFSSEILVMNKPSEWMESASISEIDVIAKNNGMKPVDIGKPMNASGRLHSGLIAVSGEANTGLTTRQVSTIIGVKVNADVLKELGNQPLAETHIGKYWRKSDIPEIIQSVIKMLEQKRIELEKEAIE